MYSGPWKRTERGAYETSNALAEDVRRFLVHEPVAACPPSVKYKVGKFCRRNRRVVATLFVLVVSLTCGLLLAIAGYQAANREKQLAIEEARKARLTVRLFTQMLGTPPPGSADHEAGLTSDTVFGTVHEMLKQFASTISARSELTDFPDVEANLRMTLGWALGYYDWSQSLPQFQRAPALRQHVEGLDRHEVAVALFAVGHAFNIGTQQHVEAEKCFRQALAEEDYISGGADSSLRAVILHGLAGSLCAQNRLDEALEYGTASVAMHLRVHGMAHSETGWGFVTLAVVYRKRGDVAQAAQLLQNAVDVFRRRGYAQPQVAAQEQLGTILWAQGELEAAEAAYMDCLTVLTTRLPHMRELRAMIMLNVANLNSERNKAEVCESYLRQILDLEDQDSAIRKTPTYVNALLQLTHRLIDLGDRTEAEACLDKACSELWDRMSSGGEVRALWLDQVIDAWISLGKPEKAQMWQKAPLSQQ